MPPVNFGMSLRAAMIRNNSRTSSGVGACQPSSAGRRHSNRIFTSTSFSLVWMLLPDSLKPAKLPEPCSQPCRLILFLFGGCRLAPTRYARLKVGQRSKKSISPVNLAWHFLPKRCSGWINLLVNLRLYRLGPFLHLVRLVRGQDYPHTLESFPHHFFPFALILACAASAHFLTMNAWRAGRTTSTISKPYGTWSGSSCLLTRS